jgi:PAS domain S-box-containing protein
MKISVLDGVYVDLLHYESIRTMPHLAQRRKIVLTLDTIVVLDEKCFVNMMAVSEEVKSMPDESSLLTNQEERLRLLNALRESELLRELSELLASSLDPNHILQVLVRRTTEVCDVERCAVWLLDEASQLFLPSAYHFNTEQSDDQRVQTADYIWHHSSLSSHDPVIHRLLEEHGLLVIEDLRSAASDAMTFIAKNFFARSVLLVALLREGRPVGLMSLDNPGKVTAFSIEQQQLARDISQQAAIAIHNARLFQQAQEERNRAERLIARAQSIYSVAMAVNSGEELTAVLEIALQHLVHDLEANAATIALVDEDEGTLVIGNTTHLSIQIENALAMRPMLSELPLCLKAVREGIPHFVTQEQARGREKDWFEQLGMKQVMIVPLMAGSKQGSAGAWTSDVGSYGHCVGFAFIDYAQANSRPSQGHYAFALDIAAQCALAIEKDQMVAETRRTAALATEHANMLDAVFNAMNEGIIVLDMQGKGIISNKTATRFLGLPADRQLTIAAFLDEHPTYTLRGRRFSTEEFPLLRALRGEEVHGERFFTKRADNSERSVEVNVVPLFDSEASQIGVVGAFRDVTEQVRVEQRIRRALDTMLHAAEAISGMTDIQEIARSVLAMTLTVLNAKRGAVQLYNEETQCFTPLLSTGFNPDIEQAWLEEQNAWLAPESEHSCGFRELLLEGHATLVNAEQCPEPEEAYRFKNTMILAAPITHNNHLQGVLMLDRSLLLHGNQNTTQSLALSDFNIWDIAVVEGIARLAGLAIEQARWQQEAEIARSNEEVMREANALKDEFLAITAHEFRTPLTVVLVHSQMMARTLKRAPNVDPVLQEKLYDSLSTIETQAHQLTNIVNTFLEVTRLNRGQITLSLEEVSLEAVVKQSVENHAATSPIHHISYHIAQSDTPYFVNGDSARLQQIFANLLQNAIKYSPLGGPITIFLSQRQEKDKQYVEIRIQDRGIGIPPDAQSHLFERFYRAPNTVGSKARGVGLGLYVVAEFIRLHGGTIHVESSGIVGEGSCFIFALPLKSEPLEQLT